MLFVFKDKEMTVSYKCTFLNDKITNMKNKVKKVHPFVLLVLYCKYFINILLGTQFKRTSNLICM